MFESGFTAFPTSWAVAAASHSGERVHLEVVRRILDKARFDEDALGNTPALPLAPSVAAEALRAGGRAARSAALSRSHASMLSTSVANGWDAHAYLALQPIPPEVDRGVHRRSGRWRRPHRHRRVRCADGDGDADRAGVRRAHAGDPGSRPSTWRCGCIPSSWPAPGKDTSLDASGRRLVAKGGAEGVHVAAHRDGRAVAVKVADGAERARVPVTLAALRSLGFDVDGIPVPPILGRGHPVGENPGARRQVPGRKWLRRELKSAGPPLSCTPASRPNRARTT